MHAGRAMIGPRSTTHGKTGSSVYVRWASMKRRCENPKASDYPRYGGRGITVCPEWSESFEAFYADMGDPPEGMQLDRIDNDGPYSFENCRWATRSQQALNRGRGASRLAAALELLAAIDEAVDLPAPLRDRLRVITGG